jgi:aminoglycoside phosphotransferase (APT) family kinase protein
MGVSGSDEVVGRGASSDVLAWGEGRVLKLFHPKYAYAVDLELARARAVHALGAPCPAVFEKVEHEGRIGIVYERVDGPLLRASLSADPAAIARVAELQAGLHRGLHAVRVPASARLPSLRQWLGRYVRAVVPEGAARERAEAELALLPDDTGLCHMDLHPGNVIVRGGELVAVDWVNASAGPLVLDVARSYVLIAWMGAKNRDGRGQRIRLALAERYLETMRAYPGFAPGELERALAFPADALLRDQPENPFAPELQAAIPWR